MVDDRAHKHLKRRRRTDARCRDHIRRYVSVKSADFESKLLCALHHTGEKGLCAADLCNTVKLFDIHNDLLIIAFACDVDDAAVVWLCRADRIKVYAACDDLSAIMICVVADDLCSSGR